MQASRLSVLLLLAGVDLLEPLLQRRDNLRRRLPLEVGEHDLQRQRVAVEQLEQAVEVLVAAPLGGLVALEDEVGQVGGGLGVEARQRVDVVAKGAVRQPLLAAARAEQHERAAAGQAAQEVVHPRLLSLVQRVLDRQPHAGDRLQVVEEQQVALALLPAGAQPLGQEALLRRRAERLEVAQVVHLAQQLAGDGVHDLLPRPGLLVVAKVEDLVHQPRRLPPVPQVVQQRRLAGAAHAVHEQEVVADRAAGARC